MSHPGTWARTHPDRAAVVMSDTGETVTYRQLDERSNQLAHLLHAEGADAHLAILMENNASYHAAAWAARRSGRYFTTVNHHLTPPEAAYIINDCGARVLVISHGQRPTAAALTPEVIPGITRRLMVGGVIDGWESYEDAVAAHPITAVADETEGDILQYSSGTTGLPKGIKRELTGQPLTLERDRVVPLLGLLGFSAGDTYLSPAPLYHTAPIYWSMSVQRLGGTAVVMPRFDPEETLRAIERFRVTHGQFVPTMFVRMLKLQDDVRARYDLSSIRRVIHAAAPRPVETKQQMIAWWGPVIDEYYSSTEGAGGTYITAEDWLAHPGSVGRALMGTPHIVGEDGAELPPGEPGQVWFSDAVPFIYLNDEAKTAEAHDARGWTSVGDMGYLSEDGYLYLTDRKSFMIISGGVNIYPQEVENLLVNHPKVLDVAVIGVPDAELGEQVKAVVQPMDWAGAGEALAAELMTYCTDHLARYKCPRSIDFDPALPRLDTGKLYKRQVRDRYWPARTDQ